jgi:hypothetical protein
MSTLTPESSMCSHCGEHPAVFDIGKGNTLWVECEECAKLKAALDMLEIAARYALMSGATRDEVRTVVDRAPADYAQLDEPGEWQRGYLALEGSGASAFHCSTISRARPGVALSYAASTSGGGRGPLKLADHTRRRSACVSSSPASSPSTTSPALSSP